MKSSTQLRYPRSALAAVALAAGLHLASALPIHAQRVPILAGRTLAESPASIDAGALPTSQPLTLTLRLAPTDAQRAGLDQFLTAQHNPASAEFHHWLTPAQFASRFGITDDPLAELTIWLQTQGLIVTAVAPSRTRLTVTGTVSSAQAAFATSLHRVSTSGSLAFATTAAPTLPPVIAPLIAGVSDANDTPIITTACATDVPAADQAAYETLFRQANAQGITATNPSFPASLPEITALTLAPSDLTTASPGTSPRPLWQASPGLPPDATRHAPDVTTTSTADFSAALTTVLQQSGTRQGNINPTLYALAPTPGLYTQPTSPAVSNETETAAGNWQPATGLGTVDLQKLVKVFPRGLNTTTTSLVSSTYAISYGNTFTLTSQVLPTTTAPPSPPAP